VSELAQLLESGVPLTEAAQRLGQPFAALAVTASELGLRVRSPAHELKLPRGRGYDKASTEKHIWALARSSLDVVRYARAADLHPDLLVLAFERYCPEAWADYLAFHPAPERRPCDYCGRGYIPSSARQRYCTPKCAADARSDRAYFNGRRQAATGMREGVCQVCGREGRRKLAAHHLLGKEADPEGRWLIALCPGCHDVVTALARMALVDDPAKLSALISLALLRRHGKVP
jgi:5-methylcytosine-specific restriction endonuclease McrA